MANIRYFPVCEISELPPGERIFIEIGNEPVVVVNLGGDYFGIADVCTHDDGPLGDGVIEDHQIVCPRHGARFDIKTGEVMALPAVESVSSFPIRVKDNMIEIGIEESPKN